MIKHRSHPEARDAEGAVLNLLDITRYRLELLIVLIIELLRAGLIDLKEILLWGLGTRENLITFHVHFLIERIVFEFKGTVKCLLFLIYFAFSILKVGVRGIK